MQESLEEGHLSLGQFSLRSLAEELVGREWVESLNPRHETGMVLTEANSAVDTSVFSNIFGQLAYSAIMDAYDNPAFIGDQLVTTVPTTLNGERIPGMSTLGDDSEIVDEAQLYPTTGIAEDWIDTPVIPKRGHIVPVTKEAVFHDNVHLVLTRAGEVGNSLGISKDNRILDVALGETNNYKRRGSSFNTYAASGGHGIVNQHSGVLADWSDIDEAELLFDAMTDPNNTEPIDVLPTTLIVPSALRHKARQILGAERIDSRPNLTNAAGEITIGPSTLSPYELLTSPRIKARTSSAAQWWFGNPKKAFWYMENWPITITQQGPDSPEAFSRDIVVQFKASEKGVPAVVDPHFMVHSDAGE